MKRTLAIMTLILALGPAPPARAADVEDLLVDLQVFPLDHPAPAFTLPTLEGQRVSLARLRGRVILLYFWLSS